MDRHRVSISYAANGCQKLDPPGPAWDASRLYLPHPKTGERHMCLWLHGCLQEVNRFKQKFSSWFVDNMVIEDGGLWLCTPIDPLLILLPVIESNCHQNGGQSEGVFRQREELLANEQWPDLAGLWTLWAGADQLQCICSSKQAGDQTYFRLDRLKAIAWLRVKVQRLTATLQASGGTFEAMDQPSLVGYAAGLLSEYLTPAWQHHLRLALGLPIASEDAPLQPLVDGSAAAPPPEKRPRLDLKEIARRRAAEAKAEQKAVQAAKEAATMKKLSSFFKPIAKAI